MQALNKSGTSRFVQCLYDRDIHLGLISSE